MQNITSSAWLEFYNLFLQKEAHFLFLPSGHDVCQALGTWRVSLCSQQFGWHAEYLTAEGCPVFQAVTQVESHPGAAMQGSAKLEDVGSHWGL